MDTTLQDLRDVLNGQRRSDESIFWFGVAWHDGRDDLYRAMSECGFDPDQHRQPNIKLDPEIMYGLMELQRACESAGRLLFEYPLRRVRFDDVREDDVLMTERNKWACIRIGTPWPCRVHRWHGGLGVACAEDKTTKYFHPITPDAEGFVEGFQI